MHPRYLTRQSKNVEILKASDSYQYGTNTKPLYLLDVGAECNKLQDEILRLHHEIVKYSQLNPEIGDSLKRQVVRYQDTLDEFLAEHKPEIDLDTLPAEPAKPFDPFEL